MNDLLRKLARVDFYIRWYVSQVGAGRRPSRFRGAGLEFEKITRYDLGEDPRWINWKATARTGAMRVLKNTLIEERQLQVFLVVDLSGSMDFGTERAPKRRVAAEIAAALAHVAWRMGDSVGYLGHASKVEDYWPPRHSPEYRLLIPAAILGSAAGSSGSASFSTVLERLPRKRSLLFALSDFQEDLAVLEPAVRTAARYHDLVPVIIDDPRERSLPEGTGFIQMRDLETGAHRSIWLNRKSREAWMERLSRRDEELTAVFRRAGVDAMRVNPTIDPLNEIARLFLRRRRMAPCGSG
ncbi:MAG: DUF58 domain-containing protein [Candidatus Rokubacteria bacterium]|nr:DUF58 domain-containing protein [Candidatus Rokubacteria bacterium]